MLLVLHLLFCHWSSLIKKISSRNTEQHYKPVNQNHKLANVKAVTKKPPLRMSTVCTWRQSREAFTILGHFERHANSNGRKYLSASMWPDFALGTGNAAEPPLSIALLCNTFTHMCYTKRNSAVKWLNMTVEIIAQIWRPTTVIDSQHYICCMSEIHAMKVFTGPKTTFKVIDILLSLVCLDWDRKSRILIIRQNRWMNLKVDQGH